MTPPTLTGPARLAVWGGGVVVLIAIALIWNRLHPWVPTSSTPTFRVGYQNAFPTIYDVQGKPAGVAADIFSEACRRRGIPITWHYLPAGPDQSLSSGMADLWPQVGDIPERHAYLYLSRPWDASAIWVILRPGDSDLKTVRTIALQDIPLNRRLASRYFPAAVITTRFSPADVVTSVCRGQTDAGLVTSGKAVVQSLASVGECTDLVQFRHLEATHMTWGIGATFRRRDARQAADAIREEITAMTRDGTLSTLSFRSLRDPLNEMALINALDDARTRMLWMTGAIFTALAMLVLILILSIRLSRARHLADASNRAKSEFLASMSHEIRTPLNGILATTDLLLDSNLPPTERLYAETVDRSARSLLSILNDILDFSKIASGKFTIHPEPCLIPGLIDEVIRLMEPLALEKSLRLTATVQTFSPPCRHVDPLRLRQILQNLVFNAIKFTTEGSVALRASLRQFGDNDAMLRFEIEDTGPGIPEARRSLLFQPFTQLHQRAGTGGSGLGLAICHQLAGLMGGRIGVNSMEGVGSTFWVEIPAPPCEPEVQVCTQVEVHVPANLRVLVAEDSPVNQMLIEAMLRKLKAIPVVVANGRLAVEEASRNAFDIILLDNEMPELNGTDTARQLREQGLAIPILAFTASVMDWQVASYTEAGMNGLISKPLQFDALKAALSRCLSAENRG